MKPLFFLLHHRPHQQILAALPSKCIYNPTTSHYLQPPLVQATLTWTVDPASLLTDLLLPLFPPLQPVLYTAVREISLCYSFAQNSPWFLFSLQAKARVLATAVSPSVPRLPPCLPASMSTPCSLLSNRTGFLAVPKSEEAPFQIQSL